MSARVMVSLGLVLLACKAKDKRPDDPVARVASIEPGLAKVRKLEFKAKVPASIQSAADFRKFVHGAVQKEAGDVRDQSDALVALGLLPKATDLGRAVEDAYATQAAAYYNPDAKQFYFVMVPTNKDSLDLVTAHELTHALQDQNFDFKRYMTEAPNEDARAARRFVTEGDAMFASIAYLIYDKTHLTELSHAQVAAMRGKLEEIASMEPSAMAAMLKAQNSTSSHPDPGIQKSLDAIDTIPLTVLVPLLDAYMKGAVLALDAYDRDGWTGVDALYANPPESTEQVLHPNERLLARIDHPHRVTLPSFEGYTPVASDVLGELQWGVYFTLWKHEGDGHEEENWDGDRYAVVRSKDGRLVALISTIWDTEYSAKVFYDSYLSTLETRYHGEVSVEDDHALVKHGDDSTWLFLHGKEVYVVDGGNDDKLINLLIDGTKFE